jgi:hypothetical protein
VGQPAAEPLQAQVSDVNGILAPGIEVTLSVLTGDGFLTPTVATTDDEGIASTVFTCGTRSLSAGGGNVVTADCPNRTDQPPFWNLDAGREGPLAAITCGAPDTTPVVLGSGPCSSCWWATDPCGRG